MSEGDFDDLASGTAEFLLKPEEKTEDWRDDPGWRLASYDPQLWSESDAPDRPTAAAELANPPIWASLYDGSRIVATWRRPYAGDSPSDHSATVAA